MFSLIGAWTNGWVNNRDVGDLRRHRAHYDVTVMELTKELYMYHHHPCKSWSFIPRYSRIAIAELVVVNHAAIRRLLQVLVGGKAASYRVITTDIITVYSRYIAVTHYNDVTMGAIASQITSLTIVYSTVYSDADQRKHQSSASLAFVRGIHWRPVNYPHKWPVTWKMFPFDDVIICFRIDSHKDSQ